MPTTKQKINSVLAELRPGLQMHGGDVDLVSFEHGVATLKIKGHCLGCPMATITFDRGITEILQNKIPAIREVRYA